jgi:type IV secretion system protein VirB9
MIRKTSFFLICLLGSASAAAFDSRIRMLKYEPNQIVTLVGRSGIQSTIEFSPGEHIESVAVGDSAAWQVTPNRRASLLFVKPLVASSKSNMTVVTDQRTYMFDLVTGGRGAAPIYSLRFSYPETAAPKAKYEQASVGAASPPLPPPPTAAEINFGWKTKGAANLLPARVFDDGSTLYLAWARNALLPAVLSVADDGKEAPLHYSVIGDYIVVTPIPGNVVLRYGKKAATAFRVAAQARPRLVERSVVRKEEAPAVLASPALSDRAMKPPVLIPSTNPQPDSLARDATSAGPSALPKKKLAYPNLDSDHVTDSHHE